MIVTEGSPLPVTGFRLCATHAGLKKNGDLDMALVHSTPPARAAAVFTQNRFQGAPVLYGQAVLKQSDTVAAVVVNSRIANAATGEEGLRNAADTAEAVRAALNLPTDTGIMPMSTGVIGAQLPMDKIRDGIAALALAPDNPSAAARAIMTTDTRPKMAGVTIGDVTMWGFAKGAGMIHPDMATMLAVVLTDAEVSKADLQAALSRATEVSFNAVSVDGDTSPNDTCLVLANGARGPIDPTLFQEALTRVCQSLARQIAFDGEGARHHVTVEVTGAVSDTDARTIGRTIATSPLVKTAIFGRDANWGRIISAAGRAGVAFDPDRARLRLGPLEVFQQGAPVIFDEARALELLSETDVTLHLGCGLGDGHATVWTCDLTPEYVDVNAAYRT